MAEEDRLRTHPRERLAPTVQRVDLADAAARLRAEPHEAVSGHKQLALVRHGPVSLILFAFERDGVIKEHQTEGQVVIHVLRGRLTISIAGEEVTLDAGTLLSLAPGEPHAVRALEESDMLLSIAFLPSDQTSV